LIVTMRLGKICLALCLGSALLLTACDEASTADLGGPVDLLGPDLPVVLPDGSTCPAPTFMGFGGVSDTERRLDCTGCGCSIDPLTTAAESGLWARTLVSSSLADGAEGLSISANGGQGPAFASLSSLNPVGAFYLDGDFDLLVDYELGQLVHGGKVSLRIDVASGLFWEIARGRPVEAFEAYFGSLGGVLATLPSLATSGTLRLVRTGFQIAAFADGVEIGKTLSGATGRAAIYLAGGVTGCDTSDAGSPDGGSECTLQARLRNLRLATGVLVDRR